MVAIRGNTTRHPWVDLIFRDSDGFEMHIVIGQLAILAVSVSLVAGMAFATHEPLSADEIIRWRQDLRVLATELPALHKNAFHTTPKESFVARVSALHESIPTLARHQIIVEMARLVAAAGDGHTNISPTRDPKIGFKILPLKFYFFKDGLYVRAANMQFREWIGARVLKIGETTPNEALARVSEIIGHDNSSGVRYFAPHLLAMPEILHALKLSDDPTGASLVLEHGTQRSQIRLTASEVPQMMAPDTDLSWLPQNGWLDLRTINRLETEPDPLWLRDPANEFWLAQIPKTRVLYVQINKIANKAGESFAAFGERIRAAADSDSIDTLVLDLRLNRGGNGALLAPLIRSLVKAKTDRPGHFYAISCRATFSAAQFLLDRLENYTAAIFVGEPSGSKGNAYGDSRRITLPNSGITVRASIYYWQDWHPLDGRAWIEPSIHAELSSTDYRDGVDPALTAILRDVTARQ